MFSFHHHLPEQTHSELHRWSLTLAIYDRLSAHGISPALYRNKTLPDLPPLLLHTGREWIGPTGPILQGSFDANNFSPLLRENAGNAVSWVGISPGELPEAIRHATEQVNLALEISISRWARLPADQQHPHSLESRLWAAQQHGFDIFSIYYHETSEENVSTILKHGFDLQRGKARLSDDGMPDGVFLKTSTDSLELSGTPVQLPFLLKKGPSVHVKDRDEILRVMMENPGIHVLKMQISNTDQREQARFDRLMNELKKDPKDPSLKKQLEQCLAEWKAEIRRLATSVRQLFTAELKAQGTRSLHVSHDAGSWGRQVRSIVALYPEDICPADAKLLPKPEVKMRATCPHPQSEVINAAPLSGPKQPPAPTNEPLVSMGRQRR